VLVGEVVDEVSHALDAGRGRADVAAEAPAVGGVAQLAKNGAQRAGGDVVGEQARQDEHGVAVAPGEARHQRAGGQVEAVVRHRAPGLAHEQRECGAVVPSCHFVLLLPTALGTGMYQDGPRL
jgi:hypothetical protein